ncbi:MAG TPA: dual specificity protein phosphatase family protein [Anaerolineaceae bacterium]|nr:dual specificity protein phosphatase family protein [Anaerolineaceae bacterium]HPN53965.1 dual specificity protein phosphatase family protein [Anaerolineaceae bacterium]
MLKRPTPIPDSYWVIPGRFLAGEYPGGTSEDTTRATLRSFIASGITAFIDLTNPGEYGLLSYQDWLLEEAKAAGKKMSYHRHSIRDFGTPTEEEMVATLNVIADALQAGETVYMHCMAGRGRTGTVVGCFLVEAGLKGDDALVELQRLRQSMPSAIHPSPEAIGQKWMVSYWYPHLNGKVTPYELDARAGAGASAG